MSGHLSGTKGGSQEQRVHSPSDTLRQRQLTKQEVLQSSGECEGSSRMPKHTRIPS